MPIVLGCNETISNPCHWHAFRRWPERVRGNELRKEFRISFASSWGLASAAAYKRRFVASMCTISGGVSGPLAKTISTNASFQRGSPHRCQLKLVELPTAPLDSAIKDCDAEERMAQAFMGADHFARTRIAFAGPRNALILRFKTTKSRVSHSQTTSAAHPNVFNARTLRLSRALFAANLSCQNFARVFGEVVLGQPLCRCQKQPCTNRTLRRFGKTKSGLPGKSRR
jgi:hypothetical protein